MKTFKLSKEYEVICRSEKTRYGFRHIAVLMQHGNEISRAKKCYYNRTWESYEFQSVLHDVIHDYFVEKRAKRYIKKVDGAPKESPFKAVQMACALGSLLCADGKEKNDFKKRMLGTVHGIQFPEDFDTLPEEERQRRLDGAIAIMDKK